MIKVTCISRPYICKEFNGSCKQSHPILYCVAVSGLLPCIRICITDIKMHLQMQMQVEWPCPQTPLNELF